MATRQYIGARYIPVFADPVQWDIDNEYDYLTMVQNAGETYMSKQAVPSGISLPDTSQGEESNEYWVHMSNWNAQVESYRQEVLQYNGRISTLENDLPIADFDSENTVSDAIGLKANADLLPASAFDSTNTVESAINAKANADLLPASAFDSTNTVDARFDAIENNGWVTTNRIADNNVTSAKIDETFKNRMLIQDLMIGAHPILRYIKGALNESIQGCCVWGNYAAIGVDIENTNYTDIRIYNLQTQTRIATLTYNFQHASTIIYYNNCLYVASSDRYVYKIDVSNPTAPNLVNTIDFSTTTTYVNSFMKYEGEKFAFTNNTKMYICDEDGTNVEELFTMPALVNGMYQCTSYDPDTKLFILLFSEFSNRIYWVDSTGHVVKTTKMKAAYCCVPCDELESCFKIGNKIYFSSNPIEYQSQYYDPDHFAIPGCLWVCDLEENSGTDICFDEKGVFNVVLDSNADGLMTDIWNTNKYIGLSGHELKVKYPHDLRALQHIENVNEFYIYIKTDFEYNVIPIINIKTGLSSNPYGTQLKIGRIHCIGSQLYISGMYYIESQSVMQTGSVFALVYARYSTVFTGESSIARLPSGAKMIHASWSVIGKNPSVTTPSTIFSIDNSVFVDITES